MTNQFTPAAVVTAPLPESGTTRAVAEPGGTHADSVTGVFRAPRQFGTRAKDRWWMIGSMFTPLGRIVAVACLLGLLIGYALGWHEFVVVGWITGVGMAIAAGFVIGRGTNDVRVQLADHRVIVGETAQATVSASRRRVRLIGARVELPIGDKTVVLGLSTLFERSTVAHEVQIPTKSRGIVAVGPARTVRADPIGLLRKESTSDRISHLIVHPRTVMLSTSSLGVVRDLEGVVTHDLTSSDLAFHSLREYVAGDDRRTIHWRSTAKAGRLMVRQFLQTRRSHVVIALSLAVSDYANNAEFETAVGVAGSLGASALREGRSVSVVVSATASDLAKRQRHVVRHLQTVSRNRLLDDLSRIAISDRALSIVDLASDALRMTVHASAAFFVIGSAVDASHLNAIASARAVEAIAVRCSTDEQRDTRRVGALTVCTINALDDFGAALARVGTR